jgi:hypothetical protein
MNYKTCIVLHYHQGSTRNNEITFANYSKWVCRYFTGLPKAFELACWLVSIIYYSHYFLDNIIIFHSTSIRNCPTTFKVSCSVHTRVANICIISTQHFKMGSQNRIRSVDNCILVVITFLGFISGCFACQSVLSNSSTFKYKFCFLIFFYSLASIYPLIRIDVITVVEPCKRSTSKYQGKRVARGKFRCAGWSKC